MKMANSNLTVHQLKYDWGCFMSELLAYCYHNFCLEQPSSGTLRNFSWKVNWDHAHESLYPILLAL